MDYKENNGVTTPRTENKSKETTAKSNKMTFWRSGGRLETQLTFLLDAQWAALLPSLAAHLKTKSRSFESSQGDATDRCNGDGVEQRTVATGR